MNESTSRLLEAVDQLTKPVVEHHRQCDDDGNYLKTHTVEHPPLLEQLRAAVTPSTNTAAGSASLASTRNLIDADALAKWSEIATNITMWCHARQVLADRGDLCGSLRRWYVAYMGQGILAPVNDYHTEDLRRWAGQIRNLLDPPRRVELVVGCPVCGSDTYATEDGQTFPHPVIIEYRVSDAGSLVNPRATCRAVDCGASWDSLEAIEELGEELQGTAVG